MFRTRCGPRPRWTHRLPRTSAPLADSRCPPRCARLWPPSPFASDAPAMTAPTQGSAAVRAHLLDALHADLVGPFDGDPNSAEVLPRPPSRFYLTGFLAPSGDRDPGNPTDDDELGAGSDSDDEEQSENAPEPKVRKLLDRALGGGAACEVRRGGRRPGEGRRPWTSRASRRRRRTRPGAARRGHRPARRQGHRRGPTPRHRSAAPCGCARSAGRTVHDADDLNWERLGPECVAPHQLLTKMSIEWITYDASLRTFLRHRTMLCNITRQHRTTRPMGLRSGVKLHSCRSVVTCRAVTQQRRR